MTERGTKAQQLPLCLQLMHPYREPKCSFPSAILNILNCWLSYTNRHTYIITKTEVRPPQGGSGKLSLSTATFPQDRKSKWIREVHTQTHRLWGFTVKLFCQPCRLWDHTAQTNRLPQGVASSITYQPATNYRTIKTTKALILKTFL